VTPRARGTGSIYAHAGGWRVRIRDHERERCWQLPTHEAARELLKEVLVQREEGTPVRRLGRRRLTVNVWLDEWLAQAALACSPNTYRHYIQKSAHLRGPLGAIPLDELDATDVRKALTGLQAAGMSATMLQHVYSALKTALNAAVLGRRIPRNPCAEIPAPKRTEFEAVTLTVEQAQRLIEVAWDTRLGPLLTVALSTGMRAGELMALTWDDIDTKAGLITVNKSVKWEQRGAHHAGSTKTRSSRRTVRVEGLATEALAEQRRRCVEAKLAAEALEAGSSNNLVFPSVRGNYWIPSGRFVQEYRSLLSKAGCPRIRFHDLRHTAGLFLTRSMGLVVTARMLGHSDPVITARLYGHALAEDFSAAAHAMSSMLESSRPTIVGVADEDH